MVVAPTPRFATVFEIDTFTPVSIAEGALRALTVRSTPLNTVIAPVAAVLLDSLLSTLV